MRVISCMAMNPETDNLTPRLLYPLNEKFIIYSNRTYIGCKWYGFNDPQSRISKYVWRAGTSKGSDDIIAPTDGHHLQEAFIFDLTYNLPLNVKIYCTVRAYNNAG